MYIRDSLFIASMLWLMCGVLLYCISCVFNKYKKLSYRREAARCLVLLSTLVSR